MKSSVFDLETKEKIVSKLHHRITEDGEIVIRSDVHRDQDQNRSECIRRLYKLIQSALVVPKKRVPTRPTKASQIKRLESKKKKSINKGFRKKVDSGD